MYVDSIQPSYSSIRAGNALHIQPAIIYMTDKIKICDILSTKFKNSYP